PSDNPPTTLLTLRQCPTLLSFKAHFPWRLRPLNTIRIHIQPVQEPCEPLAKPREALVHGLQLQKIVLQVGQRVREFCELWGERVEGVGRGGGGGEAGAGGDAEGGSWAG